MRETLDFFETAMPDSRPADYYLGCLDGSVFLDFDNFEGNLIRLKRISFDGYGCCELHAKASPMNAADSRAFKEILNNHLSEQVQLTTIVKKAIYQNKDLIWQDALTQYGLM